MLSLFKSKPFLKDLISDNYIDIHSHLLSGIDDGAQSVADTYRLTKALQDFGVMEIITTPHIMHPIWDNTYDQIIAKAQTTKTELEQEGISIPFRTAAEYFIDDHFITLFQSGNLLTLKDNYVLIEISYNNPPIQLYSILFDLQVAGYIPVLAHPERYLFYHKNFDEYKRLKNAGCLFQLNLLAVVGHYNHEVTKTASKLLQKGMYNFVGSDVHHNKHIAAFDQRILLNDVAPLKEAIANNLFFRQK